MSVPGGKEFGEGKNNRAGRGGGNGIEFRESGATMSNSEKSGLTQDAFHNPATAKKGRVAIGCELESSAGSPAHREGGELVSSTTRLPKRSSSRENTHTTGEERRRKKR